MMALESGDFKPGLAAMPAKTLSFRGDFD